ncbi:MAG: hypothetical protein ACLP6G_14685 [Terriglobales bacterium]
MRTSRGAILIAIQADIVVLHLNPNIVAFTRFERWRNETDDIGYAGTT